MAVLVAAVVQILAVAALVSVGLVSDGPAVDRLRPVPIAVVFALPGVLALLPLRQRAPLLLAGALSELALTVFPFSSHSFVLGPNITRRSTDRRGSSDASATGWVCLFGTPRWRSSYETGPT